MKSALLAFGLLAPVAPTVAMAGSQDEPGAVYLGIDGATAVALPRLDADVLIDGVLDEDVWSQAAVLTGFSQYFPVDGLPAVDSTDVLVWYSTHALYIGVHAHEPHAPVNATLADRDHIFGDDYVKIFLDLFHDGRRALFFAVNPLGIQSDGTETEEQRSSTFFGANESRARTDLSPDYVFDSKGRTSADGYEVEIRIPFKSLRYPSDEPQTWGFNVVRQVQHSGQLQTWTPARQGEASFLAQSGTLQGLSGMRRGMVLDVNPEVTGQVVGSPGPEGGWTYDGPGSQWGATVRWGVTTDLSANGTVNPDFSQVESDAAQIAFDPRRALSYPEKRPFFLEGAEQFSAPGNLIYTRRIVDPVGAVKLAGTVSGTDVGFLSAADAESLSRTGTDRPIYNLLRLRRPVGEGSTLGFTWTDRVEGHDYNRVGSVDARFVSGPYTLTAQVAASRTRRDGSSITAPFWTFAARRSGRGSGWSLSARGSDPDFVVGSGFQSRPGIAVLNFTPRLTRFSGAGSPWESWSTSLVIDGTWLYDRLGHGSPDEAKLHLNNSIVFRGGWNLGASFILEKFLLPRGVYDDYAIDLGADTVAFAGRPSINNYDFVVSLGTPQFPTFSAHGFLIWGRDENFAEWAPGYIVWTSLNGTWRPTDRVRIEGSYDETRVLRTSDWSRVNVTQVPRLKVEYQLARPVFVRLVGQYVSRQRDALRDDGRTGRPILLRDPATGGYVAAAATQRNDVRFDALFSYRPTPGTVLFLGYGGDLGEAQAFHFSGLDRRADAFFVKLSYLFRM
jgi:hypothetical protein